MLEACDLSVSRGDTEVLRQVSLSVEPGEIVVLAGPNGAGKTTLLKTLIGFLPPKRGEVRVDGRAIGGLSALERAQAMAYLPQLLSDAFSTPVFDTVLMGRRAHLAWRASSVELQKVERWLRRLGLAELALREVGRLSGGQRQRVYLARALAQEARYLLLDEPTSSLDLRNQLECMETLQRVACEDRCGMLVALHDLNLASRYGTRVVLLHRGHIAAVGRPEEVLDERAIRLVYGVEVSISRSDGHLHIVALQPAGGDQSPWPAPSPR